MPLLLPLLLRVECCFCYCYCWAEGVDVRWSDGTECDVL
jgi:hypothetical protein